MVLPKTNFVFFSQTLGLLKERGLLSGPETGLLSNTRKRVVQGDTSGGKARDFLGKGSRAGSCGVREPRRTALPGGSQSWGLR